MLKQETWFLSGIAAVVILSATAGYAAPVPLSDPSLSQEIRTPALTAEIQGGLLRRLTHNLVGQVLFDNELEALRFSDLLGGSGDGEWKGELVEHSPDRLAYLLTNPKGGKQEMDWRADEATGDLILEVSQEAPESIGEMTLPLTGIDIQNFAAVLPSQFGECQVIRGPATGTFSAGYSSQMAMSFFLFEGERGCWAIAVNDADDSSKGFELKAAGNVAALTITQGFWGEARERRMFPLRFQACRGSWHSLADRFAEEWLEQGLGLVPLTQQPAWIRNIRASVGISVKSDLSELETLADQLIPAQTLLYVTDWRTDSFDFGYPDYTPTETFKIWCARARNLGFHVAAHFNMHGVNKGMDEYFERFKPGLNPDYPGWAVQDPDTGFLMWSLDSGRSGHYYVSSSYRPWRDFYVNAVKPAVDCGVDVVHLDESHTAMTCPAAHRDIPNIFQGNIALQKALREAYPRVSLQGEQFNDMNMRHVSFAQIAARAEHTVALYLFSKFVKFVKRPDGGDLNSEREGYEQLGFKLPWGHAPLADGIVEEMRAFQDYQLDPAPELELATGQKFGYRGREGVIACLERNDRSSGLAVYLPNGARKLFNVTHFNITEYAGGTLPDWLIYDGNRLLGLHPKHHYRFNRGVMPQEEFHLCAIPPDFQLQRGVTGYEKRYYIVEFTAHGPVQAVIPSLLTEVYANGQRLQPDAGMASFTASGETSLIAFPQGPELSLGPLNALPWAVDGARPGETNPAFTPRGNGFFHHAGAHANIMGRLPAIRTLKLRGALIMDPTAKNGMVGMVSINGRRVVYEENLEYPWTLKPFAVDLSGFAGQDVMIQFATTGSGGYNYGGWEGFEITGE